MGTWVTLADLGIAFLAGLLIIPAMYVAQAHGTQIFDQQGALLSGPNLIFQVLPELFNSLGVWGMVVAVVFFLLMTLAALTSSISILEVPTSYLIDNWRIPRKPAAYGIALILWMLTMFVVFNQDYWFQALVTITTQYSQPLLGLSICIFVGWVVKRNILLSELAEGNPEIADSFFFKVWPFFLKFVCPVIIILIFLQSFLI
jgi:NSS family neurotransmitter:Na+ symporter